MLQLGIVLDQLDLNSGPKCPQALHSPFAASVYSFPSSVMIEQRGKRLTSHTYNVKDRQPYCALVKAQFVFCARGVESAGDVRLAIRDSCAHWILHISTDP